MNKRQLRRSIREQKRAMTQTQIREKSEQLARLFLETEELMVTGFTPEEQETLLTLLKRVASNLEEDRGL